MLLILFRNAAYIHPRDKMGNGFINIFIPIDQLFQIKMSLQRSKVIELYKTLLYMGRDYPQGYDYFRTRCHGAFMRNKDLGTEEVDQWLAKGDYIVKELEALYMLKKYRTLKRRYEQDPLPPPSS